MIKCIFKVYRIEIEKLLKRKDYISVIAIVAISLLFGFAILSDGYTGINNQSAIYWVCTQLFNSTILFVTPLIISIISTRILSEEIENGSLLLYTNKIRNRNVIYWAKSFALTSFISVIFFLAVIINLLIYYIFVVNNQTISSGKFLGNNSIFILFIILMIYFFSFFFCSQITLALGSFLKPNKIIILMFILNIILVNTYKIPYIQIINPWYYLARVTSEVLTTTNIIDINISVFYWLNIIFYLLIFIYTIILNLISIRKFKRLDL